VDGEVQHDSGHQLPAGAQWFPPFQAALVGATGPNSRWPSTAGKDTGTERSEQKPFPAKDGLADPRWGHRHLALRAVSPLVPSGSASGRC